MAGEPRRRRLGPDERRAEIVRAADCVLAGRDPSTVTFEEIAAKAGVSRALVYNYFGDRGGLLAAVYRTAFEGLDAELSSALAEDLPPRERVHRVVGGFIAFAKTRATGWASLYTLAGSQHPAVAAARSERYARLAADWGGGPKGRLVAAGLLGLLESSVIDWIAQPGLEREQLVELLEDLAWSGLQGLLEGGVVSVGALAV